MSEDGPPLAATLDANDADGNLDPAGFALVDDVTAGGLVMSAGGTFTFDPADAFHDLGVGDSRAVTFTFTARDSEGAISEPATVTIDVVGQNDAPTLAAPLLDATATVGAPLQWVAPASAFVDVDDAAVLTWSATGLPAWMGFDAASRTLSGTPALTDVGAPTITITVTDEHGASASDTLVIDVAVAPSEPSERFIYDAAGRLVRVTFRSGAMVDYTYDQAGNVLRREVSAP